jgi:prolyl oligopeptidase
MSRFVALTALLTLLLNVVPVAPARGTDSPEATDPYLWLEDVNGARATDWVKTENAKTLDVLQQDPRFAGFYEDALAIGQAKDRIPNPQFINGHVYNFWQDADHVRGIWRTTTLADYTSAQPAWKTVLDLDALAASEGKNWVWHGADCDSPSKRRCLIRLSEGGEDADTVREFDLERGEFVADGFALPRGKQSEAWADDDTLLVSREWEPGQLTASGYPYVIKELKRGQALADAREIMRGSKSDVGAGPDALHDAQGHRALTVVRDVSFFESETSLITPSGLRRLDIPLKSSVIGLVVGHLLVKIESDWNLVGASFRAGDLLSLDLAATLKHPERLRPTVVYVPGARDTLDQVATTRDRIVVVSYENVKGRAFVYKLERAGDWSQRKLDLPDNSSLRLGSTERDGSNAFLTVTGFLTPATLMLANVETGAIRVAKSTGAKFDASNEIVEQRFAISKDGTHVPYFVVRPKNLKFDGSNPTILNAYGGFGVSMTPSYSGTTGKLWLEHGGVYVLANIRGGGEFGPAWHEAGLKTHRQRIYDDFAAVAKDLIAKGITSPRHLGIRGGSNGGLLMGVEFTQHPELWNAVAIEIPLLDMLRYEKIEAGASWVGEYGTVAKPDERAFLASISPYNNLKAGVKYPEPFIWTTTKDDRVGPEHARKFAAKLAGLGDPYLYYEVTEGGHGAGANIKEQSFTTALEMAYFTRKLMN